MDLDEIVRRFESLQREDVARMREFYAADAFFKDPFNEVRRVEDIEAIFLRMFDSLHEPRFSVVNRVAQGDQAFLEWDFTFRIRRWKPDRLWCIRGVSHLRFGPDGRIAHHRDFWDTGEELYGKLPVLGGLIRFLRHRMG
jgi:steroid delta-isomerase